MLKIHYINGSIDGTIALDPAQLTGDVNIDRSSAYVQQFVGGSVVAIGSDGYIKLAEDGDAGVGVLVNDVAGYSFENTPALASGKAPAIIGGCVADTDRVKETDIVPGDLLYVGTGSDAGLLTKVKPQELTLVEGTPNTVDKYASEAVAVARTANSVADKTVTVQVF